jgi:cytochrome o ubiquinol oxidase subunit II
MTKHRIKFDRRWPSQIAALALVILGIVIVLFLQKTDITLFNPKGLIASEQLNLFIISAAVLLLICIPTLFFFYFFAWKYRETNEKAVYEPDARHDKYLLFSFWAVPTVFMFVLMFLMWPSTHKLDPHKAIASDSEPLTIQVIAMRWKWLFIYPEQKIATVNFIQVPTGTPLQFELTADEVPMSSFWIPHLGGQLYAMTGHINTLHLMADTPGDYPGSSAEINGSGFAGMKFMARASSEEDFDHWIDSIQKSYDGLDAAQYEKLLKPSENSPYEYYSNFEAGLYDKVVMKYMGSHASHTEHE